MQNTGAQARFSGWFPIVCWSPCGQQTSKVISVCCYATNWWSECTCYTWILAVMQIFLEVRLFLRPECFEKTNLNQNFESVKTPCTWDLLFWIVWLSLYQSFLCRLQWKCWNGDEKYEVSWIIEHHESYFSEPMLEFCRHVWTNLTIKNVPTDGRKLLPEGLQPQSGETGFQPFEARSKFRWNSFRSVFVDAIFRSRWPLQKGLTEQTSAVAQMRWEDAGILSEMGRKSAPSVNVVDAKITCLLYKYTFSQRSFPPVKHDSFKKIEIPFQQHQAWVPGHHFKRGS